MTHLARWRAGSGDAAAAGLARDGAAVLIRTQGTAKNPRGAFIFR
jgi:hypothetical protein